MKQTIRLSDRSTERLRSVAAVRNLSVPELLEQAVESYLSSSASTSEPRSEISAAERLQIDKEHQAFVALHQRLLESYADQYVAMREGQVIDHDYDRVALSRRVRARYGNQPVLIAPVLQQAVQTIRIRSPRLEAPQR
jgi:hypothetical protein